MKHHLKFGRFRLQRGRNRGRGEGVGGTFTGIISLLNATKSSIFESCWIGVNGANKREQGQGLFPGRLCDPVPYCLI